MSRYKKIWLKILEHSLGELDLTDERNLWLVLFNVTTREDLKKLILNGDAVMSQIFRCL